MGEYNLSTWLLTTRRTMQHAGSEINIGDIIFEPPRDGPTLWEIGIPDRSAAEFYVPDPNPKYINKLYVNHPDK